jgi:hypothetical protein
MRTFVNTAKHLFVGAMAAGLAAGLSASRRSMTIPGTGKQTFGRNSQDEFAKSASGCL